MNRYATPDDNSPQNHEPLFDVIVSLPPDGNLDALMSAAQKSLKLGEPKANLLRTKLAETKAVTVKSGVPLVRAEEIKSSFLDIGFNAWLKPHLSLEVKEDRPEDTRIRCPACDEFVELGPERQCPSCGVFVDKLTPEMLLRKQILAQERMKRQASKKLTDDEQRKLDKELLERRIRKEVKEELDREMGLSSSRLQRQIMLLKVALPLLVVASAATAFYTGRFTGSASTDTQLAGSTSLESQQLLTNFLRGSAQLGQAMQDNGELSFSEIIASVGQPGGLPTQIHATTSNTSEALPLSQPDSLIAAASIAASREQGAAMLLADAEKLIVSKALTRSLAEMGHVERSREMLRRVYALNDNSEDYRGAISLRLLHIEVETWSMVTHLQPSLSANQWSALQQAVAALPSVSDRVIAYGSIGRILSHAGSVYRELSASAFESAAQALTIAPGEPGHQNAMNALMLDLGENLFIHAKDLIHQGAASRAGLLSNELSDMANQAPSDVAAVLSLQAYWVYRSLGRVQEQRRAMNAAIAYVRLSNPTLEMAVAVQRVIELATGGAPEDLIRVVSALDQRLSSVDEGNFGVHGTVLAMYEILGAQTEANLVRGRLRNAAINNNDLTSSINASFLLTNLAEARHAKRAAQYPQKEKLLRDVASSVI